MGWLNSIDTLVKKAFRTSSSSSSVASIATGASGIARKPKLMGGGISLVQRGIASMSDEQYSILANQMYPKKKPKQLIGE